MSKGGLVGDGARFILHGLLDIVPMVLANGGVEEEGLVRRGWSEGGL